MAAIHHHTNVLIRKLESLGFLSPPDRAALAELPVRVRTFAADQEITRQGDTPTECCLVVAGFLCRYIVTSHGKRQILSFHSNGDLPDLQSLNLGVMDYTLATLAPSTLAFVQHETLHSLIAHHPQIRALLWRDTLIDAAIFRQWMVSMGRRSSESHLAHLVCELLIRMGAVGLVEDRACRLPITQSQLGDALGISTVHVNRVLQDLRRKNLLTLQGGVLTVLDWEGLTALGEFDPTYLSIAPANTA